jgi:hypothetical protein
MLYYALFFFVALGAKLLLALVTIYLLFPTEASCVECDGETLPVRPAYLGGMLARLAANRLQWRWCPRCGWEGLSRTHRLRARPTPLPSRSAPTPRH